MFFFYSNSGDCNTRKWLIEIVEVLIVKPFPKQALAFTCLQYKSFENTVEKGEIARNEQFLLFPLCFLPVWRTLWHFIKFETVVCRLFQFGRV